MDRPDPLVVGDQLTVAEHMHPLQVGAHQHPMPDHTRVHRVVVGIAAHIVIPGQPQRGAPDATSSKSALAQRLHGLAADEQLELLVGLVCLQAAAVLGRPSAEDVDPDTEFGDLGFDSLTAVELRNRLKTATGLTLPPTVIFDHPTPTAVAEYVAQQMSGSRPTESGDPTSQVVEPAAAEVSVHA